MPLPPPPELPIDLARPWPLAICDKELALLEAGCPSVEAHRLQWKVQLAWHLRQRDSTRSKHLIDEVEQQLPAVAGMHHRQGALLAARMALVRAEHHWLQADLVEAQQLSNTALDMMAALGDLSGQADAALVLAAVAFDGSRFGEAQHHVLSAQQWAGQAGDEQRWAVSRGMRAYWSLVGDPTEAEQRWGADMAVQQTDGDPVRAMWAWMYRGQLAMRRGLSVEAIPAHMRASELARQAGQLRRAIGTCTNVSAAYLNLNDSLAALQWTQQALELARPAGWPASLGMCLSGMAAVLKGLKRPTEARQAGREAQAVLQSLGSSRTLAVVELFLADLDVDEGHMVNAMAAYRALLAQRPPPDTSVIINAWFGLGRALTLCKQGNEALLALETALRLARGSGLAVSQIKTLQLLGEVHARFSLPPPEGLREASASLHYLGQAVGIAAGLPGYTVTAELWDQLAQAHAEAGDLAQALQLAQRAAAARDHALDRDTRQRALALALRHEIETARADSERLRERARHAAQHAELLRANHTTLEQLSLIGQEITGELDIDSVFDRIHAHLQSLVDVSHLAIWLVRADGQTLGLRFGVEGDRRLSTASVHMNTDFSNVARCLREDRELLHNSPIDQTEPSHMPGTVRTHTALFGPLKVRGRTVGVLSIQSTRVHAYGERERLVFRSVCAYGAIALDNAATFEQLQTTQQALLKAGSGERQARLQTQEATRLKNKFLARVSHDLREPLTLLHASLQEVERSAKLSSPEGRRASLRTALARSHQVNALARELLELARLESGAVTLAPEPFSLADLAHDVLQKCEQQLATRQQQVSLALTAESTEVVADIGMIERVLTELVHRASTLLAQGSEVSLRLITAEQTLWIGVADATPSLPPPADSDPPAAPSLAGDTPGMFIAREMLRLHGQALTRRCDQGQWAMGFELDRAGP